MKLDPLEPETPTDGTSALRSGELSMPHLIAARACGRAGDPTDRPDEGPGRTSAAGPDRGGAQPG